MTNAIPASMVRALPILLATLRALDHIVRSSGNHEGEVLMSGYGLGRSGLSLFSHG